MNKYITVVELSEFRVFVKKHLSEKDVVKIVNYLANDPKIGDIIVGSGGLRKFRWAMDGKGKSGGFRIIYYYHNDDVPVFLIAGFAKNEMKNISKAACNQYQKLLPLIVEAYKANERKLK
jgi:hypothetical protein